MTHTPGPWNVYEPSPTELTTQILARGATRVADVWCGDMPDGAANARLIAAAPEMLEALKALLDRLDHLTTEEFSRGGEKHEREQARALLARIEGKEG